MKQWIGTAFGAALACGGLSATAQEMNQTLNADAWTYELQLYLWGTDVGGTANGADFELGFSEIIENLNFVLMGGLKAYNGPWMGYGEIGYADLRQGGSKSKKTPVDSPLPDEIDAVLDADIQSTVVSFGAGYRLVETPSTSLYGTFGLRYLKIQAQAELEFGPFYEDIEGSEDYWTGVVGLMGRSAFDEKWFVQYTADVGTGAADLTWQLGAGIGYNLGRSDIVFGYRHMEWDLPDDDLITNYYQTGPVLLWNFRF